MEKCQVCNGEIINEPQDSLRRCSICAWPAPGAMDRLARKEYDLALLNWSRTMYGKAVQGGENLAPTAPGYLNYQASVKVEIEALISDALLNNILALTEKINRLEKHLENPHPNLKTVDQDPQLQRLVADVQMLKDIVDGGVIDRRITALEAWQQANPPNLELIPERPTPAIVNPAAVPDISLIQAALNPAEQALVKLYNQSQELPPSFASQTLASLDSETSERQKLWDSSQISFVAESNGIFTIVKINDALYLLPNKKRTLTPHIYRSFKFIFDRTGFHKHCKNLTVIKPAIVQENAPNQWQLLHKGVLQFYQT